jgi:alanyl-tRNA synthetase
MTAQEIRNEYLKFFEGRGHKVIPRAPLVLQNDPTTLFTGSGMQQLMPYLLGEPHPSGARLVDSQPSFRAQDIEEIGDNRHTTFFEMLGNWSLGDYFKAEQLPWMFEFMIDVVGLDVNKFYVTCFIGDEANGIPKDTESGEIWKKLYASKGVDAGEVEVGSEADGYNVGTPEGKRIFYYDASKNWWCRGGKISDMPVGEPGGPDSEMFYRFDDSPHSDTDKQTYGELCHPNCDCGRYMEIGNNVFMEYVKRESGFEKLPAQNVDQGAGLERIAAAALDNPDVFKISVMWPIIETLQKISGKTYESHTNSMRVIADHLRGATFLAVDGVVPSNKEQGYVMRRLVRRAIRFAFDLGVEQNFLEQVIPIIADMYEADYPEIKAQREAIIATMIKEEKVFRQTLRKGLNELTNIYNRNSQQFTGEDIFTLYDTYGFPSELSVETLTVTLDNAKLDKNWKKQFDAKMQEQRDRSKTASKGTFKGGLGGQTLQHKKYHTATHLMYQALRDVLGDHVVQNGSNITEERLRFDFSHPEKVTPEQIKQVEDIVNEQIQKDLKVSFKEYPTKVAIEEKGALGQFGDRYGDTVKVYKMIADGADKPFSFEICGGPHVDHTLQLAEDGKHFKILKEESSSAGIRRIKAVLA